MRPYSNTTVFEESESSNPSGPLTRALFRGTLAFLGLTLEIACCASAHFRSQVAHPRTVYVGSADGVHRVFDFTPRAVTSRAGRIENPSVGICFENAWLGIVTLLSPRAVGRINNALLERKAEYEGNAVLVLWFFALTRFALPVARTAPLKSPPPDAYIEHDPNSKVASRIVIEPAASELDPAWTAAHARHAQMIMPRGSAGEPVRLW